MVLALAASFDNLLINKTVLLACIIHRIDFGQLDIVTRETFGINDCTLWRFRQFNTLSGLASVRQQIGLDEPEFSSRSTSFASQMSVHGGKQ